MASPTPAFLVARAIRGSAHVFQVYIEPRRICFIRIGAGPGAEHAMAAHGGLIGALIMLAFSSARKKKEQRRIEENQTKTIDQMLTDHKVNHAIWISDMTDVSLEPGGWTMAKGTVNWRFQVPGEKKRALCIFRKVEDIAAAMEVLPRVFRDVRVEVQLNERSGKYLKKKPGN